MAVTCESTSKVSTTRPSPNVIGFVRTITESTYDNAEVEENSRLLNRVLSVFSHSWRVVETLIFFSSIKKPPFILLSLILRCLDPRSGLRDWRREYRLKEAFDEREDRFVTIVAIHLSLVGLTGPMVPFSSRSPPCVLTRIRPWDCE